MREYFSLTVLSKIGVDVYDMTVYKKIVHPYSAELQIS